MTRYPSFFSTPDEFNPAGFETLLNFAEGAMESTRRLTTLQIEAVQSALTEQAKQFRSFLENSANTTAALSQWSVLFQASAERFNQMTSYYLETASRDFMDVNRWFGQSFPMLPLFDLLGDLSKGEGQRPPFERRVTRDRRVQAQLITFPERRAAELAKAASNAAAESSRQATGAVDADAPPTAERFDAGEESDQPIESAAPPEDQEELMVPPVEETPAVSASRKPEPTGASGKRPSGTRRKGA
jgi:hypothetical protein